MHDISYIYSTVHVVLYDVYYNHNANQKYVLAQDNDTSGNSFTGTGTPYMYVFIQISLHVVYCPNMYDVMWSAHGYKWNIILYADFIHSLQDVLYRVNKIGICFSMRTGTFSCEVC